MQLNQEITNIDIQILAIKHMIDRYGMEINDLDLQKNYSAVNIHIRNIKERIKSNCINENYKKELRAKLIEVICLSDDFKIIVDNDKQRRLKLIFPYISDEELNLIEPHQVNLVYELYISGEKNIYSIIYNIKHQYSNVLKLEHSVKELHELYNDMDSLADKQKESVYTIQSDTKESVHDNKIKAIKYKKKTRCNIL
jgi:t-SNARE complex subunit (syntaxin)